MPSLYIITGSNGAGKSSVGPTYLPEDIKQSCTVFNGDNIFIQKRNELWKNIKAPKEVRKLAHEYMLQLFEEQTAAAMTEKRDYVYEGHFTNENTWDVPRNFKSNGYTIHLIFFGLKDPDTSQFRVLERSQVGGHWVDRRTIEENFHGNLEKLNKHFDIFDTVHIIETSSIHVELAMIEKGHLGKHVPFEELPHWFQNGLPRITHLFNP